MTSPEISRAKAVSRERSIPREPGGILVHLGFDPIWFGILIVVVVEIGLISPPVGMILFLMHSLHPEIPMTTIYRGVMPFFFATIVMLAVLIAFPEISLVLPRMIFGGR